MKNRNKKYNQLWQLTIAHFKETIREPAVLFWGIVFPILMSLALGIAFTKKQNTERKVAVINSSENYLTDSILSKNKLDTTNGILSLTVENEKLGNTTMNFYPMSWEEATIALKRGRINVILEVKNKHIEYHFDPVNTDAQLTYRFLSNILDNNTPSTSEDEKYIKPLTVTGTRYIDFLIPGLVGMGLMMSSMWGLSYSIIEKRSKKLLRRMVATPMKKSYFLISLITVRTAMNFIEALLLIVFAKIVFNISIEGSIPALLIFFIAANTAFAGLAIFISSRTAKTEIGNGLINVVVMPMMLLSGIFFSYHNFPDKLIPIIKKLPLTLVADGVRSIFIEGAGFPQIVMPFLILTIGGIILFGVGLKMFKWY